MYIREMWGNGVKSKCILYANPHRKYRGHFQNCDNYCDRFFYDARGVLYGVAQGREIAKKYTGKG